MIKGNEIADQLEKDAACRRVNSLDSGHEASKQSVSVAEMLCCVEA